ncbi:hypothetical protein ACFQI7_29265 [Paenibacillus allorhizosphaerae]|uniref:Multi-TM2 domain-containing protein n=1 Tax=Paenibacillus allorhizosphaerae TaxID=2849866 RepID=A0ABM8VRV5_9BACL|nr:hypothetical protein [Paenibacillus allorhizosphaerae]CAG7655680.1 hypothetical protein PAECIP111802_06181 [Paenibacillus allorhizosphaerae]
MNSNKSPMTAFLLSFIPGLGHLYLGRTLKGMLYGAGCFGSLLLLAFMVATRFHRVIGGNEFPYFFMLFVAVLFWGINMIDMLRTLLIKQPESAWNVTARAGGYESVDGRTSLPPLSQNNERFHTILLSFIPGLGHFQLGLMQRGLAFLVTFFGLTVMILFVAALTHRDGFFVFLGILPIIWLYGLFDIVQQLNRKERGEPLLDRTIFEDFQEGRDSGKKNKTMATLLAMFPGAGHMYLGLQKRGLQFMAAFLFSIYIMDTLRLSLFLFLIPILWFYSFFDALQHISKVGREELRDVPIVDWLMHHQRWIGIAILALGVYYLFDQVLINALDLWLTAEEMQRFTYWFDRYFQTTIVCVLLIGGGIRLLLGSKKTKGGRPL